MNISPSVFTVFRVSPKGDQQILTLTNVTDRFPRIEVPLADLGLQHALWRDLISSKEQRAQRDGLAIELQPYDVIWLTPESQYRQQGELM